MVVKVDDSCLLDPILTVLVKGSIIPVAPGRMRNMYYPQRKAEYVTQAQIRTMHQKDLVIERDFAFGLDKSNEESQKEDVKAPEVKLALMTV